jgi:hypothetical protein
MKPTEGGTKVKAILGTCMHSGGHSRQAGTTHMDVFFPTVLNSLNSYPEYGLFVWHLNLFI